MQLHSSRTLWFPAILMACLFVIASPLVAQQAPILVTQPVDNSVRTVLPGNVHPLARAEFDRGEAPADMPLHRMLLVLKRSDQQETALRRLIENQQYKKSPSYHQWLTPDQFGAQFGPADSDLAAVTNWLTASGFQIAQVSRGRTVIEFSGTAGQVKQAFRTAIHKFVVKGEQHWANAGDPSIPTALAPVVAGLDSLHNFLKKAQSHFVGKYSAKTRQLQPAPNYTFGSGCGIENGTCYGLGPYDFATIYDLLPLWNATPAINGAGQTIAIVGRTDIDPTDATEFWSLFGLDGTHAPQPTLNIIYNGPNPGFTGDEPEGNVDVQWSGAVAPGATIDFVTSESTETTDGIDLSALYIVDNNLAPVMSESYGSCEYYGAGIFYGPVWEQAAAQGISVMVSTGDNGSAGCDYAEFYNAASNGLNVNGLASTPFNAAIGGTDFNQYNKWTTYWNSSNTGITQESAISYIPETTWNDSCTNVLFQTLGYGTTPEGVCNNSTIVNSGYVDTIGGSGGQSGSGYGAGYGWLKPTWQTGAGVPNDNARDLPDVSLFASNDFLGSFYIICEKDRTGGVCDLNNFLSGGGTSFASPAFAGIMALVNQKWGPQGVPGLILYNLASKQPSAFHDVPSGSTNAMPCWPGSDPTCITNIGTDEFGVLSGWPTTTAYDLATGLGSVDANNLVANWNKVTFTPTTTTLTLSPGTITHGTAVPVTVSVTSNKATGDVALLVSPKPGTPGIDWSPLTSGTASWKTNLLPGGTYQVIAHYEGDTTYGGSYSTPSASITVNPENSSVYMPGVVVGVDVNGSPVYSTSVTYGTGGFNLFQFCGNGCAYWLRADVQNSQPAFCNPPPFGEIACPTGTITFLDNSNSLTTATLGSLGYTEDQGIQLTGGSHVLVGSYGGDASYKPSSNSPGVTIIVAKAATSISNLASNLYAVNTNQQFTLTATVSTSSVGLAPTGAVTFLANGTPLTGTVQLTPVNGVASSVSYAYVNASLTTSISTGGTYNITATYTADTNYSATTSTNPVQIVVTAPTPDFTLAVNATPNTTLVNQNVQWNGTLTAVNGYSKSVTLSCTAGAPTTCTIAPNPLTPTAGGAAFTVTVGSGTAGTYNFSIQGTDGTLTHSQSVSLTVNPDFSVPATLSNPPTASPGQTTTIPNGMTIQAVGAGTFTNTVTYACSGLPTGATCSFSPTQIASGTSSPQTVQITVNTAGPFTGAAGDVRRRASSQEPRLWLPLSLPLAGMVLVGLAGRGLPRRYKIVGLCLTLVLAGFLVACGSSSSSSPPPAISVTVTPSSVNTLWPNLSGAPAQAQQFKATVNNSTNQNVNWEVNGVAGGNATFGTIDTSGNYTAPAAVPSPATFNVTAVSQADTTKSGNASVTIQTPTPSGTYPVTVTLTEGTLQHTTTFTLIVN